MIVMHNLSTLYIMIQHSATNLRQYLLHLGNFWKLDNLGNLYHALWRLKAAQVSLNILSQSIILVWTSAPLKRTDPIQWFQKAVCPFNYFLVRFCKYFKCTISYGCLEIYILELETFNRWSSHCIHFIIQKRPKAIMLVLQNSCNCLNTC